MSFQKNKTPNKVGKLVRAMLRHAGAGLFHLGAASFIIKLTPGRKRALLYHAIEEQTCSHTRGLGVNVPPQTFGIHLDYFKRYYNVVSMSELLKGGQIPCSLVITFDDGYASVERNAVPELELRELPATIYLIGRAVRGQMVWVNRLNQAMNDFPAESSRFLSTYPDLANLDNSAIINRIQTAYLPTQITSLITALEKSIPALCEDKAKIFSSADDILAMQKRGIEFGFHTNDHYNLRQCSQTVLERQLDLTGMGALLNSNTFAYPFGYFSGTAIGSLTQQGYERLMTVGNNNHRYSELHLDRSEVFETEPARIFGQLEIEEPVMAGLRALAGRLRAAIRARPVNADSGNLDQTTIPETSKPR